MTEEEKKLRKTIFEKIEQKYKLHFRDHLIVGMAITETLTEKDKQIADLEKQIEEMKFCLICKYDNGCGVCLSNETCKNKDKWELVE